MKEGAKEVTYSSVILGLMSTNRSHNQGNNLYEFFGISCIFSLIIILFFCISKLVCKFELTNTRELTLWLSLSLSIYIYRERDFCKGLEFFKWEGYYIVSLLVSQVVKLQGALIFLEENEIFVSHHFNCGHFYFSIIIISFTIKTFECHLNFFSCIWNPSSNHSKETQMEPIIEKWNKNVGDLNKPSQFKS